MEKRPLAGPDNKELRIALLGGLNLSVAGNLLDIGYAKLGGLLAYLAVSAGSPLRREHLADLFWPEMTAAAGRQNLRRALFNLRSAMSEAGWLLSAGRDVVTLDRQDLWLDVAEFIAAAPSCIATPNPGHCKPCITQMEHMAELYRGEFMAGFSLTGCPDFEDWLHLQRESLHRRALAILERLSNCHEQVNSFGKALPFALRYTELEPWGEEGHRRAIRLYALNGQSSAALGQYDSCCRMLEKELGVRPSDETRSLAESIRKGEWRLPHPGAAGTPPATVLPLLIAERRQVTVLYCEVSLPAIDDPDEAIALLHAPQARCKEIIRQFSGYIVNAHGGGLLAYFGYPQARENAARLAVQAALAVTREAVCGVEIRAGGHTGIIITSNDSHIPDAVGKTSMLAIQLRLGVAHNEVAISDQTHQLVTGYFDCISLGVQSLPGVAQPLEIFRAIQESLARNRLDAAAQLTPLTGRKAEIAKLAKLWDKAAQGTRQVLLIQGEAGIGKSRLLHTLKEKLRGQPHAIREFRCSPEFSQSPFYPLIAMFEAAMGFAQGDTHKVKIDKLVRYLESHCPASIQDAAPLLAQRLSLPLPGHFQAPGLSPQKQKDQTIVVLLGLLQSLAAQQPVLLIVEDLHWIDPSTLELLTRFVEQTGKAPILAIFTARPEFDPPWSEGLESSLVLAPLAENEVAQMIASLNNSMSAVTLRRIVERADGIPLFVEEMAKIATLDNQASIPATLHDLLAARMDSMGEAKYSAQLAATLGRVFDLDLLRKIFSYDSAALANSLSALQDSGLILKVGETACQFKHALIQEAAYQSQSRIDRQAAHKRVAQVLLSDFPDVVANHPELLAQHLSSGGETKQSIEYWIKAGQRAALNSANLEASEHFNSGLQLLMTLPSDQERDWTEFRILVSLCPVLYAAKGYGGKEVAQTNARIAVLSGLVGDSTDLFQAKWALLINTVATTGSRGMPEAAMQLLGMAHDDPTKMQAAHHLAANASFWLGEFETSHVHSERAIALYHPDHLQILLEQYGTDLSAFSAGYSLFALYFLGFPDRAKIVCGQMLDQARKLAHPHTLAQALSFAAVLHRWLNNPCEALSLSSETIAIARQHDFSLWLACGEMIHGWALVMHGQKEGVAESKSSIAGMRAALGGISVVFLSTLIEAYMHLKQYDEALDLIAEAQADGARTGDGHFTAELHRLKGECLLALSPSNAAQAESCFDEALAISRRQRAKTLQLRAAMSMARLWQLQAKPEDARRLLEDIHARQTESLDSSDLQEAANQCTFKIPQAGSA